MPDSSEATRAGWARRLIPLVLLAGVVGGVGYEARQSYQATHAVERPALTAVRGAIGSEKAELLADPAVTAELARNGLAVTADRTGSREIVTGYRAGAYDFSWPSGSAAAARLRKLSATPDVATPFYTPMVIVSWKAVADVLQANGVVEGTGAVRRIDVAKLIALMEAKTRWRDLKGAAAYPVGRQILVTTTDVTRSNSAGMYLGLVSYVLNGNAVIDDAATAERIGARVAGLFSRQGFQESTSADPFADFVAMGKGNSPLLFAYESQVVEHLLKPDAARRDEIVILYPTPGILSKHTLVPYGASGRRLADLMSTDPVLRSAAARHGFRPAGGGVPREWSGLTMPLPATIDDIAEPPSFDIDEIMIGKIAEAGR